MNELSITVLVDNTAMDPALRAEHGLALWIETGDRHILFDTGMSDALLHNAAHMGIDPGTADILVLSHGHYDHTGGLGPLLSARGDRLPTVYAHPRALAPKYGRNTDGSGRENGMVPAVRAYLTSHSETRLVEGPTEVVPGVSLTGPVPRETDFEDTGGAFYTDSECRAADPMPDDQAMFADTAAGLVVVLGCAHAGVVNTLRYIRTLVPDRPFDTVIGGMHLGNSSPERMDKTVTALRDMEIRHLYPIHCTGRTAAERFRTELGSRVAEAGAGTRLAFV